MIIQAELKCKQTGCEAEPCAVDSLPCDLRLLDEGGLNGLTEGAVVLFADSGHGYHRDSQLV